MVLRRSDIPDNVLNNSDLAATFVRSGVHPHFPNFINHLLSSLN